MASVLIDPFLVVTPAEDETSEKVEIWLNRLKLWLKEALTTPHSWLNSIKATEQLDDIERFPSFKLLRKLQQKHRVNVNITQIMGELNQVFRNPELDLETMLGYFVLAEENEVNIKPESFIKRGPIELQTKMLALLVRACACKQAGESCANELSIATLPLVEGTKELEVSATIALSEPDFEWGVDNKISQSFPLLFVPEDLLPRTDILKLWSEGEKSIRYAIEQEYQRNYRNVMPDFRVGLNFINSVNEAGQETNETLLTKIIWAASVIIAGDAKSMKNLNLRHLRESKAADSPQRIRSSDKAKAWRLTLVSKGAGWRMHYWEISDSAQGTIIELANVLKKQDQEEIY